MHIAPNPLLIAAQTLKAPATPAARPTTQDYATAARETAPGQGVKESFVPMSFAKAGTVDAAPVSAKPAVAAAPVPTASAVAPEARPIFSSSTYRPAQRPGALVDIKI